MAAAGMTCANCGLKYFADKGSCPRCGEAAAEPHSATPPGAPIPSRVSSHLAVASAISLLLGAVLAGVFVTGSKTMLGWPRGAITGALVVGAFVAALLVVWLAKTRAARPSSTDGGALAAVAMFGALGWLAAGRMRATSSSEPSTSSYVFVWFALTLAAAGAAFGGWVSLNARGAALHALDCTVDSLEPPFFHKGETFVRVHFSCPLPDGAVVSDSTNAVLPPGATTVDSTGATLQVSAFRGSRGLWYMERRGQELPVDLFVRSVGKPLRPGDPIPPPEVVVSPEDQARARKDFERALEKAREDKERRERQSKGSTLQR